MFEKPFSSRLQEQAVPLQGLQTDCEFHERLWLDDLRLYQKSYLCEGPILLRAVQDQCCNLLRKVLQANGKLVSNSS